MIKHTITMEFILTWAVADAVNSWLHENDMSNFSMSAHQGVSLFLEMEKSIQEFVDRHNIQFQGNSLFLPHMFAVRSCTKATEWIGAVGPKVNHYCYLISRVCEIRDAICDGIKELHETNGFSIEGELIYEKQTNYWLKMAQNMGRLKTQNPTSCHLRLTSFS